MRDNCDLKVGPSPNKQGDGGDIKERQERPKPKKRGSDGGGYKNRPNPKQVPPTTSTLFTAQKNERGSANNMTNSKSTQTSPSPSPRSQRRKNKSTQTSPSPSSTKGKYFPTPRPGSRRAAPPPPITTEENDGGGPPMMGVAGYPYPMQINGPMPPTQQDAMPFNESPWNNYAGPKYLPNPTQWNDCGGPPMMAAAVYSYPMQINGPMPPPQQDTIPFNESPWNNYAGPKYLPNPTQWNDCGGPPMMAAAVYPYPMQINSPMPPPQQDAMSFNESMANDGQEPKYLPNPSPTFQLTPPPSPITTLGNNWGGPPMMGAVGSPYATQINGPMPRSQQYAMPFNKSLGNNDEGPKYLPNPTPAFRQAPINIQGNDGAGPSYDGQISGPMLPAQQYTMPLIEPLRSNNFVPYVSHCQPPHDTPDGPRGGQFAQFAPMPRFPQVYDTVSRQSSFSPEAPFGISAEELYRAMPQYYED